MLHYKENMISYNLCSKELLVQEEETYQIYSGKKPVKILLLVLNSKYLKVRICTNVFSQKHILSSIKAYILIATI